MLHLPLPPEITVMNNRKILKVTLFIFMLYLIKLKFFKVHIHNFDIRVCLTYILFGDLLHEKGLPTLSQTVTVDLHLF